MKKSKIYRLFNFEIQNNEDFISKNNRKLNQDFLCYFDLVNTQNPTLPRDARKVTPTFYHFILINKMLFTVNIKSKKRQRRKVRRPQNLSFQNFPSRKEQVKNFLTN